MAYSLIGTTDTKYSGDLDEVHADQDDVDYLLTESRRILPKMNLTKESILYTYAGIRPLAFSGEDETKISRKHRVIQEGRHHRIITIAGGKLTTYRNMAKDVVDAACGVLGNRLRCVTDKNPLPGGLPMDYEQYLREAVPEMAARHQVCARAGAPSRSVFTVRGPRRSWDLPETDPVLGGVHLPGEPRYLCPGTVQRQGGRGEDAFGHHPPQNTSRHDGSRGIHQAPKIAVIAAKELKWSEDEKQHQIEEFKKALNKELACLRGHGEPDQTFVKLKQASCNHRGHREYSGGNHSKTS